MQSDDLIYVYVAKVSFHLSPHTFTYILGGGMGTLPFS